MPESLFSGITFHKDKGKTYASADYWLSMCTLFLLLKFATFTTLFSKTVVQVSGVNLKIDTQQVILSQKKKKRIRPCFTIAEVHNYFLNWIDS